MIYGSSADDCYLVMQSRTKTWAAVWTVVAVGSVLSYPTGQSSLLFGFWPSHHFVPWSVTLLCLVLGGVFAYDLLYNYYPEWDGDVIEAIESDEEIHTVDSVKQPVAASERVDNR